MITQAGDHIPFVATQLLEGAVPLSEVATAMLPHTLAAAASAALAAVHAQGVAHCDVRGDNLLLLPDCSVRLLDFGHARLASGPEDMARDEAELRDLVAELMDRREVQDLPPVGAMGEGLWGQAGHGSMGLVRGISQGCYRDLPPSRVAGVASADPRPFPLRPGVRRLLRTSYGSNRTVRAQPLLQLG